ncbi:MAG TPA: FecR domain-containing protein [Verrucomicrobiae bacterium]|nr:FecR domain-containing protein [Verrucomicrobiae bacterium]
MKTITLLSAVLAGCLQIADAASLTESTVTEIIKDVNLLPANATAASPAKLKDLVKAPDRVRTGAESRTELTAPDNTITRIGANTVFSFEAKDRVLNLEKGSLLFHSPKGAGGGTIKSGGASAAVLGTTLIIAATDNGGFKVIVLEGQGRVTLPNGRRVNLNAGQMVFVLPAGGSFSDVLDINLAKLVAGSLLVKGFSHELPSVARIDTAIKRQNGQLKKGRAMDTGITADEFVASSSSKPRNGLNALDHNSYQSAVHPALTSAQLAQLIRGNPAGGQGTGGPGGAGVVVITDVKAP